MSFANRILNRSYFILILLAASTLRAQPVLFQKPLSPRIANYDIDVSMDPKSHLLKGHELLTWYNKSSDVITAIPFHLYQNAFRNNKSTFMRESAGSFGVKDVKEEELGYIEITSIKLPGGEDITKNMRFIQPDDDNAEDKTVAIIPLAAALRPGESAVLSFDFTVKFPQPPRARSGIKDEYIFAGQWFPKAGVYTDGKWNCHQYHSNTEFFADFGVYNVRITVPDKEIVGATGIEYKVVNNGDGISTHYYHAEDVHDFAWTSSPEYLEFKGKAENVDIRVLLQPDHANQAQRHLDALKTAIEYFHKLYGDYPYSNFTLVDPRRGALGTGGMEYPTLVTSGTAYGMPECLRLPEMVIIHEFGHNYWYGMVASNEFEESWLDEGINSYSEYQIMSEKYGPDADFLDFACCRINDIQFGRSQYILAPSTDPVIRYGWEYYSGASYGVNSYMKPGLILTTLQNYLGKETMLKLMRTYFERWRFKHPKTKDFIAVANEVSGEDLNWFFDQALYSNATLDYSVEKVTTTDLPADKGYDFNRAVEGAVPPSTPAQSEKADSAKTGGTVKMYFSQIDVRRIGTFKFPVEVEATFEGGEKVREKWDGQDLWKKFRYLKPERLVSACVDPDGKIPLDANFTNNSKTVQTQRLGINKTSAQLLFWVQSLFDMPELLNLVTFLTALF